VDCKTDIVKMDKPTIICLTPVRNEAWILDTFLQCTSLWADYIIIADQNSTDGSRDIARKYSKVILIDNNSSEYNEYARQELLLNEARKIKGKRLLISLDADEIFTADFEETSDWQLILNSEPGESFGFRWINIKPDFKHGWLSKHFPWALMDDNSIHDGKWIHSPRLPIKHPEKTIDLEQIKVLHYQFTNWRRMVSKHRFYQCLERINKPHINPIQLYRVYHHMNLIKKKDTFTIENSNFRSYENRGITVRRMKFETLYWFDEEVLKMFSKYGTKKFKNEAIWDVNWNKIAKQFGFNTKESINDPRSLMDRMLNIWLKISYPFHKNNLVNKIDNFLISFIKF
jgi:hypothetical protein